MELRDLPPAGMEHCKSEIEADFTAFYGRWHLLGLVTWDLPLPVGISLRGSGQTISDGSSQAVHLPPTLTLPARCPPERLLQRRAEPHLAEWQAIQKQRGRTQLSYGRLSHVMHLHFLRNVALASRYGDRFRRRLGALDWAFADYFEGGDTDAFERDHSDETVRRLRLWIDRRLEERTQPASRRPQRNR